MRRRLNCLYDRPSAPNPGAAETINLTAVIKQAMKPALSDAAAAPSLSLRVISASTAILFMEKLAFNHVWAA